MSLRPALLRQGGALARRPQAIPLRAISTTSPRRAGHKEHHAEADPGDATTRESWFSTPWRNTLILLTLTYIAWPYMPSPPSLPSSPTLSPEQLAKARADPSYPLVTRLIARMTPDASETKERNLKHLELTKDQAEGRLLMQEAQQPKVRRFRNPAVFEQASPYGVSVGSQCDLSDLKFGKQ